MPAQRTAKSLATAFGAQLRAARLSAGLTQQVLAEGAEVDPIFVSFLENGHRQPSLTVLVLLERTLGLEPGELVRRTVSSPGAGRELRKPRVPRAPRPARGKA